MACREEELVLLANGRLGAFAAWKAQRHVKGCAACQRTLRELTALGAALQAVTQAEPSEALDYRIASRRYEAVSRFAALSVVGRFAAPILGLVLGLAYGGFTVTRPVDRQVQATATIPVLTAPRPQEWTDANRLIYMLQRKNRTAFGYPTSWIRQRRPHQLPEIAVSFSSYNDLPTAQEPLAVSALKHWSSILKASPELKALGWRTGDIQQLKWKVPRVPDRSNDVLMWGLVGLGLGCAFWGLRWLGGWLPGGLPVTLGIGLILAFGMAVVPQVTNPRVQFQTTLQFAKASGKLTLDEFDECRVSVLPTGTGPDALLIGEWMDDKTDRIVVRFSATSAPAVAARAIQKWTEELKHSKALALRGYTVTVVEPVAPEPPLEQGKRTILPYLMAGAGAGLIMGLLRRR